MTIALIHVSVSHIGQREVLSPDSSDAPPHSQETIPESTAQNIMACHTSDSLICIDQTAAVLPTQNPGVCGQLVGWALRSSVYAWRSH